MERLLEAAFRRRGPPSVSVRTDFPPVVGGGAAILRIGIGDTFVPEDFEFMGLSAAELRALHPRLVPLLAHDRAGFGSGVLALGVTTTLCLWCGGLSGAGTCTRRCSSPA
ncbi:MAG TPA: hypothetical protein VGR26_05635 [Acidimicrobiales bacterium]|nr:hypothetical protein [Acidimicrobiales bacterium]